MTVLQDEDRQHDPVQRQEETLEEDKAEAVRSYQGPESGLQIQRPYQAPAPCYDCHLSFLLSINKLSLYSLTSGCSLKEYGFQML